MRPFTNAIVSAHAPTRIDLAGGTLDIWPLYALHPSCTVNLAINLRARVRLAIPAKQNERCEFVSVDQDIAVRCEPGRWGKISSKLPLVAAIVKHFWHPEISSFDLTTDSDSPAGAGLGGSSALNIALCAAFARITGRRMTPGERVELAKNLEAGVLGIPTGIQDYWAAIRGNLNVIRLAADAVHVVTVPQAASALADRLVLIYSGTSRNSGINNWQVLKDRMDGNPLICRALERIASAAEAMADALGRESWRGFVRAMRREWEARRELSSRMMTPVLERAIDAAKGTADAWKVCGAGGGGCMVFAAREGRQAALADRLMEAGFRVLPFHPDREGLRVHIRREKGMGGAGRAGRQG